MANAATGATGAAAGTREDLQSELNALKSDLGKVRADLRGIADALLQQGRSSASAVRERLQDRMDTGVETVQEYLEQHPITSLLVVLGIGLVLGKLMNSK
jgi:ElaB/YqjD/DUF883 family membrane-anchored ribosome-binding protein